MKSVEVVGHVQSRLTQLHALKQHRYLKYWQYRNEYKQAKPYEPKEDSETKYGMNTAFAIVNAKAAAVLANPPKYDFAALTEEAARYKKVRELFWEYVWEVSNTSREITKIVYDAMKYWTGFGYETTVKETRKVQVPMMVGDDIKFEEKEIVDYEGCKLTHVSWDRVYVNWRNLEDASEAVIIDYIDRDEFLSKYSLSPLYSGVSDSNIPKGKYYYVSQGQSELTIQGNPGSTDRKDSNVQAKDTVSVLRYWNRYKDQYVVVANGVWINPIKGKISPILSPSKEIPLVSFTDHYLEDDIYGLGEFDISAKSRKLKDTARSMAIEVVRAQAGIITIDPDSDFDEAIMEFGMRKYARVERDKINFFAPNINSQTITYIENKADEDITIETGIDFRSLNSRATETATHTQGRIQSQKERISLMMKFNAYTFYERLARLRSANMEFIYWGKKTQVPVKWMSVDENGNVSFVNNGYGLFTMKPEYFSGKIALIPRVDSMVGDTTFENKQEFLQMFQMLVNLPDPETWKPLIHPMKLIEAGRGIIDKVIDIDKINEKAKTQKSPEQILKDAGAVEQPPAMGMEQWGPQPWVPEWAIPPEQRSGRPLMLPSMAKPLPQWM